MLGPSPREGTAFGWHCLTRSASCLRYHRYRPSSDPDYQSRPSRPAYNLAILICMGSWLIHGNGVDSAWMVQDLFQLQVFASSPLAIVAKSSIYFAVLGIPVNSVAMLISPVARFSIFVMHLRCVGVSISTFLLCQPVIFAGTKSGHHLCECDHCPCPVVAKVPGEPLIVNVVSECHECLGVTTIHYLMFLCKKAILEFVHGLASFCTMRARSSTSGGLMYVPWKFAINSTSIRCADQVWWQCGASVEPNPSISMADILWHGNHHHKLYDDDIVLGPYRRVH